MNFTLKAAKVLPALGAGEGLYVKNTKSQGQKNVQVVSLTASIKELSELKAQEMSLKSFLRFLQFLFLVFAVFFIAVQMGLEDTVEFLQYRLY